MYNLTPSRSGRMQDMFGRLITTRRR